MKLRIEAAFSESQKAQIVARGDEIGSTYTFEMLRKYAAIFPALSTSNATFRVANDEITILRLEELRVYEYRDAKRQWVSTHHIKPDFCNAIADGTLQDAASCDQIMQKIEKLLDAKEAAKQTEREKTERDAEQAERERPEREARETAQAEENRIAKEARDAAQAAQAATDKAEREAAKAEKLNWIEAHGSEKLRKGTAAGYNCQKQYIIERAGHDIGAEYVLDHAEEIKTKARSCPSLTALEEAERVAEIAGYTAKVMWLPDGFRDNDPEAYMGYDDPCEAIEARFEGYYLYREID